MTRRKKSKPPAVSAGAKTIKFDQSNEVRAIARERVGAVKPAQTIVPKTDRKKPKHKKPLAAEIETEPGNT